MITEATQQLDNVIVPTYFLNNTAGDDMHDILSMFKDKPEFELRIKQIQPGEQDYWEMLMNCVEEAVKMNEDIIIICDSGHRFTTSYNKREFLRDILTAGSTGCNILLGGGIGFKHAVPVNTSLYWIDLFTHFHFAVLFRNVFTKVLAFKNSKYSVTHHPLSFVTSHKIVCYPFVSVTSVSEAKIAYQVADKRLGVYRKVYTEYLEKAYTQNI